MDPHTFITSFLKFKFTPCKAEQPLPGLELLGKKSKKIKTYKKSV